MGEYFLLRPAFISFVGNNINITLLKVTGIETNQIKMKRLEEMGRSTNKRSKNACQRK